MQIKSSLYADSSYSPLTTYLALLDCISIVKLPSLVGGVLGEVCVGIELRPPKTYQRGGLDQKSKIEIESNL